MGQFVDMWTYQDQWCHFLSPWRDKFYVTRNFSWLSSLHPQYLMGECLYWHAVFNLLSETRIVCSIAFNFFKDFSKVGQKCLHWWLIITCIFLSQTILSHQKFIYLLAYFPLWKYKMKCCSIGIHPVTLAPTSTTALFSPMIGMVDERSRHGIHTVYTIHHQQRAPS